MGKLLLAVGLLLAWLWYGPGELTLPDFTQEAQSVQEEVATDATSTISFVIDGDTVVLADNERVRLLGIDTPEEGECYYQEATKYVEELALGRTVRLEADAANRDEYDRLLRHVFVSVTDTAPAVHVNERLVQRGYAEVLEVAPNTAYREALRAAEQDAKATNVGRWSVCQ